MLDVTRLRVLAAVARHGSVTAAARALNYAQPSVSHHLARLEAETGAKLTERAGRGVRLTEAGQLLAQRAEEIIGRIDAAAAELGAHIGQRERQVRVAAFPAALATIVAEAAAAVLAQRPAIELLTVQAEAAAAIQLLRTGQADVAVTTGFPAAGTKTTPPDGMQHLTVLDEPVYLIERGGPDPVPQDGRPPSGTADSPPGSRAALTDADLAARAGQRWIAGTGGGRDLLLRLCARAGFTPAIACTTDDYAAAQALVAAGLGVTVLPGLALRALRLPAITATTVPGVRHRVTAVTHADPAATPAARRFVRALVEAAGQCADRQPG